VARNLARDDPGDGAELQHSTGIRIACLFPANNVAVYDHTAADPRLYRGVRLVFLVGKRIEPACLATLRKLVEGG